MNGKCTVSRGLEIRCRGRLAAALRLAAFPLVAFPLARATYSVSVEMVWYAPDDPRRIEGRATHAIEHFSIVLRHNGETMHGHVSSVCGSPR